MDFVLTPCPARAPLTAALAAWFGVDSVALELDPDAPNHAGAQCTFETWPEHDAAGLGVLWPDPDGPAAFARLARHLARALGGRVVCDGSAFADRPGPYWSLEITADAVWLADDSEAEPNPSAVRRVRRLDPSQVFGPG